MTITKFDANLEILSGPLFQAVVDKLKNRVDKNSGAVGTHYVSKGWAPDNGATLDDGSKRNVGEVFVYHRPFESESEQIQVDTVKLLYIAEGKRLSRHYHVKKSEFFHLVKGELLVELWDKNGKLKEVTMKENDKMFIPAGQQHRMTGLVEESILLEVSTLDEPGDSYRIEKGD